jgi:thiamine biosynthesis lipoprotein
MKKILCFFLVALLLSGCAAPATESKTQIYEASFLDLFDTLTVLKGSAESEEAFQETAQFVHDELESYHRLFDIYNDYEGLNNLKAVNDMAGIGPVEVGDVVIDLLKDCRSYYELTDGRVNVAMGSVLRLWHDAREHGINDPVNAKLPDRAALEAAAMHVSFDSIIIDEAAHTVFISDPNVQLDVGAVAKGWAAQRVAEKLPCNMLLSIGGNVCATGPKTTDGTPWVIGVQNPDGTGEAYLHTLYVSGGSYVTSGDYQRAYTVEGKSYHHIIDPDTLMPSEYWRSVTIICDDSGLADALSTALFVLPREAGQSLLDTAGAMVIWVDGAGKIYYSPGVEEIIRT